jgi:galactosylceramidase
LVQQAGIKPVNGAFTITLDPESIYSLSTTIGQQKGSFENIPPERPFPFPYDETFEQYTSSQAYGHLPHYTADIAGAFELADRPDGQGRCIRQVVPISTISWAPDWMPYTIIGDERWSDYEVSADVYLNPDDSAAVMGRINHVGTGYGFIPKAYFFQLGADGKCRLVVVRGKPDPKKLVGDAEQQALIRAQTPDIEGGEKVLATGQLNSVGPNQWHNLKLRFEGSNITAYIDDKQALSATDTLYPRGMAGLLAGVAEKKLSTPYFDNLLIKPIGAPTPPPSSADPTRRPIYAPATQP